MTGHIFRSFADSLGAAIHVRVEGDNDHHKTEACFKAFGRALRQAIAARAEARRFQAPRGVCDDRDRRSRLRQCRLGRPCAASGSAP
jgi:imidazoleglycerol phosphate dehydratase HisB